MLNTFGAWSTTIPGGSLETTIDYVVTGGTIDNANMSIDVLSVMNLSNNKKILDFGCGIGRNAIPLALENKNCDVYLYDNPKMIGQMTIFCEKKYKIPLSKIQNIRIFTNWDNLKNEKFDYIYATLVFQHISENALSTYLSDIKNMTKYLIVAGRRFNDDGYKNTWQILEKNGLYPINVDSYKTDGDKDEHQMAVYKLC